MGLGGGLLRPWAHHNPVPRRESGEGSHLDFAVLVCPEGLHRQVPIDEDEKGQAVELADLWRGGGPLGLLIDEKVLHREGQELPDHTGGHLVHLGVHILRGAQPRKVLLVQACPDHQGRAHDLVGEEGEPLAPIGVLRQYLDQVDARVYDLLPPLTPRLEVDEDNPDVPLVPRGEDPPVLCVCAEQKGQVVERVLLDGGRQPVQPQDEGREEHHVLQNTSAGKDLLPAVPPGTLEIGQGGAHDAAVLAGPDAPRGLLPEDGHPNQR
mmetsp:Transcript_10406/g.35914  ORF Transcript_10406/g.35914 Transcript_10406/m.35914 type:complete len:266 (+) Transcript_10406:3992-4789(+)